MADLTMSVTLTRTFLNAAPLNINDGISYKCAPQFLGTVTSWNRTQVTSPFIDGAVTVARQRQVVMEPVAVEVYGRTLATNPLTPAVLQSNMAELIAAFCQDSFTFTVIIDGTSYSYTGEASDYQVAWTGPRFMARQGQVVFTMPRQPVAVAGGV